MSQVAHTGKHNRLTKFMYIYNVVNLHLGRFPVRCYHQRKGCKLALRIKRELVNSLPSDIDAICKQVGELRRQIQMEDKAESEHGEHEDDAINNHKFNSFVPEFNKTQEDLKLQRARWLSQIVEYYPLNKLGSISLKDLSSAYKLHKQANVPGAKRRLGSWPDDLGWQWTWVRVVAYVGSVTGYTDSRFGASR